MKEILTNSQNHSVRGTKSDFLYKFVHSATMVSAIFANILGKKKKTKQPAQFIQTSSLIIALPGFALPHSSCHTAPQAAGEGRQEGTEHCKGKRCCKTDV